MVIGLLLFLGCYLQLNAVFSPNDYWLLIAAQRFMAGGTYYHHFVENNPPLIIFLSCIPVLIANIAAMSLVSSMQLFVVLISILSLLCCWYCLKKMVDRHDHLKIPILLVALGFVYWILPTFSFGEREHLMLMLVMPYLLCVALRAEKKNIPIGFAMIVGICAGLGFGLKPYFLVTFILVECYLIGNRIHRFRVESLALCATLLAYCVAIVIFTPAYITNMLPMITHFYLGYEVNSWHPLVFNYHFLPLYLCLLSPIFFRHDFSRAHFIPVIYFAMIGFIVAYLCQQKLWFYHMYPPFSLSFMLVVLYFLYANKTDNNLTALKLWTFLFICLYFFIALVVENTVYAMKNDQNPASHYNQLKKAISDHTVTGPVYFFTEELSDIAPLSQLPRATLSPRFPALWMLPGVLNCLKQGKSAACYKEAVATKQYLLQAVADDFKQYHPTLVFVYQSNHQPYLCNLSNSSFCYFNDIDFFSENTQFKKIWQHYRYVETVYHYRLYRLSF